MGAVSSLADRGAPSASAIVANAARWYHLLRIDGYSLTKDTPTGKFLRSRRFTVGGHPWRIKYYRRNDRSESEDYIAIYLELDEADVAVKAHFQICFAGQATTEQPASLSFRTFNSKATPSWGYRKFIRRDEFEKSNDLKDDDSFTVRCDVVVVDGYRTEETPVGPAFVSVPPSSMLRHLGRLLKTGKGADVAFEVAGETFPAHRCVLAARSPVFEAELYGSMKESHPDTGAIRIRDMEPRVFKAMLYFVYTDSLPKMEKDDEDAMCQLLIAAADLYSIERLKLICERRLCKHIGAGTVASILAVVDRYNCGGLKKACCHFLSSPVNLAEFLARGGVKN